MQVFRGLEQIVPASGCVLSIGDFDGVHRGHARLIEVACALGAERRLPVCVVTFEPHPATIVDPQRVPPRLTTLAEKLALLERAGVARCVVLESTPALLRREALDFLVDLVARCRPRALVEGPDFRFGRGRAGSVQTLREHAGRWDYQVHIVDPVRCDEVPGHPVISSSSIRQALLDGRVDQAHAMLGRPYRIVGLAGGGSGRGSQLGFPTANLDQIQHLLPHQAVYAAVAQLEDGALHLAAVNVGPQPTFSQGQARVEAHLLDFDGDLRGRPVGLHFLMRLRGQQQFSGPDRLREQLRRDVDATRHFAVELDCLRRLGPLPLRP